MTTKVLMGLTFVITICLNSAEEKSDSQWVQQSSIQVNQQGDPVHAIAYASDTDQVYSGSFDKNREGLKIWNSATLKCVKILSAYWVQSICYSSQQQQLAVGDEHEVKIFNQNGNCIYTSPAEGDNIYAVEYSLDSRKLAYGSNAVKVFDCATNQQTTLYATDEHTDKPVKAVRYSPDGQIIAAGLDNKKIQLIDSRSPQKPRQYETEESIYALDWYNDVTLAFGGNSKNVYIQDTRSSHFKELSGHTARGIYAVRYSPDGKYLASGSWDKTVKLWDPKTYACLETLTGHDGAVRSISWIDNDTLASSGYDGLIKIWTRKNTSGSDDEED